MNAQEMFEELGYLPPERKLFSERNGHVIPYFKMEDKEKKKGIDRIMFHTIKKTYTRSGFTRNYEDELKLDECPFNHFLENDIKLHQAITQQMIELGWI